MKVVSDVLLLSCLHKFDLWATVEAGQASACLYSEARLYKGPSQSTLPQSAASHSTGNISVGAGLWIRIHFLRIRIRIRIQWIRMEANTDPDTDPDPDPDPIRIQGFNDQKLKKNNS